MKNLSQLVSRHVFDHGGFIYELEVFAWEKKSLCYSLLAGLERDSERERDRERERERERERKVY